MPTLSTLNPNIVILLRVAAALALGALIGLERQFRQRNAGLRTNALVSVGAASFVTMSMLIEGEASPTRMAAQVVSGIGFLGGGVIIREGASVRGLNTAATLWGSGSVGVLAGSGLFIPALIATLGVISAHLCLRPLGHRINQHPQSATEVTFAYRLDIVCDEPKEAHTRALLLQMLSSSPLRIRSLQSRDIEHAKGDASRKVRVRATLSTSGRHDDAIEPVVGRLSLEPGISEVSWEVDDD